MNSFRYFCPLIMKKLISTTLIAFCSVASVAQISLSLPVERMIYQRNNSNQAYIHITGNFITEYDSIMAKVFPRVAGQGTEGTWQTIDYRDDKPYFYGKYLAHGGWYKLGVKAYLNGEVVDSTGRERVGIGEVFAIAGQSNATGTTSVGYGFETIEDRSNVLHYASKTNDPNALPIGFSQMNSSAVSSDSIFIGPFQIAPWHWGKLSEDLVDELNVPVLLFGAGFGGTHVNWWYQSAYGIPLSNPAPNSWNQDIFRHPYGALENVLQYYSSLTGIRAVLWHQGEADHALTTNQYKDLLEPVISKSREHIESPSLAWVVARAAYSQGYANHIITAQDQVILNDANVFGGPNTDAFVGGNYRSDDIHLDLSLGLTSHATSWFNALTTGTFFSSSTPILSEDLIEPSFSCNVANSSTPVTLTFSGSFADHAWSNRDNTDTEARGYASDGCCDYTVLPQAGYLKLNWGYDSTSSITVGPGRYALNVRKPTSGKILFSPIIDLTSLTLPTNPGFTVSASQIRPGDTLTLTGNNCNGTYLWSTSDTLTTLAITPPSTASYTLACKTLHCLSNSTTPVEVVVSSCFGDPLNLAGSVNTTEAPYQSQQTIQSTQLVNQPSGNIEYSAAQSVLLKPGFKAENGAVFRAIISDCP